MSKIIFKNLKNFLFFGFLILTLNSCTYHKNVINGTNDFQSLSNHLVIGLIQKIRANIGVDEVVLVSDFVNIDKLENKSELGFLLSSLIKDELLKNNLIVKEITLGKEFQLGSKGFNLLIRDRNKIISNTISTEKHAFVGTYSITNRSLNLFLKLIDIQTGNILASSFVRTDIDDEILELDEGKRNIILPPRIVL